ncbi:MAG: hypothetical protein ACR2QM_17160, partial [Longimicrobiales bacterium]
MRGSHRFGPRSRSRRWVMRHGLLALTVAAALVAADGARVEVAGQPPSVVGEPPQSAGTLVTNPDGSVSYFYRTGSWDFGGFSPEVYEIVTRDAGQTWSDPAAVVDTGPNTRAQNFLTVSPVSGELIVFYMGLDGKVWRVRTSGGRSEDADNKALNDFSHAGIAYGHCIWVDLPAGGKRSL